MTILELELISIENFHGAAPWRCLELRLRRLPWRTSLARPWRPWRPRGGASVQQRGEHEGGTWDTTWDPGTSEIMIDYDSYDHCLVVWNMFIFQ